MKRILAVLLAALMLAGLLPLGVLAEETEEPAELTEAVEPVAEPEPEAVEPETEPEAIEPEPEPETIESEPEPEAAEPEPEPETIEPEAIESETEPEAVEPEEPEAAAEEPAYIWAELSGEDFLAFVFAPENAVYLTALVNEQAGEEYIAFAARIALLPEEEQAAVNTYLLTLAAAEPEAEEQTEETADEPAEEPIPEEPAEEEPYLALGKVSDAKVCEGAAALKASVSGTAEGFTYQWQQLDNSAAYDSDFARSEAWTDIPGATGEKLTFTGIDEETYPLYAGMLYRCVVRAADDAEISGEARLLPDPAWTAEEEPAELTEEAPVEETPAEELPAVEAPAEEIPTEEAPDEEIPAEEPAAEAPAEEEPAELTVEAPAEEIPAGETAELTGEAPAEEIPAEELPAEEVPAEGELLTGEGMELLTTPQDLRDLIEQGQTTIDIADSCFVYDTLEIPAGVTINVKAGGILTVSITGGRLTNRGTIKVEDGGTFECIHDSAYSGTYIQVAANGTINPVSLPHNKQGVTVTEIREFHVGKKIKDPDNPGSYIWVAGTNVPAEVSFEIDPDNADTFEMNYSGAIFTKSIVNGKECLSISPAGEYTITATSVSDPSVSNTCKVVVSDYEFKIYDSNDDPFHNMVEGGSSVTVTVELKPVNITDTLLKAPVFTDPAMEQYASLSYSGGPDVYTIELTAKEVTETHNVEFSIATADGLLSDTYSATVYPRQRDIRAIWDDGSPEGIDITDTDYYYDIDSDPGLKIKALVLPTDANQIVHWEFEDSNHSAKVVFKNNDTAAASAEITASGTGNEGLVILSGKTANGTILRVQINMVHIDATVKIDVPANPIPGNDGFYTVRAKQTLQCSATVSAPESGSSVKWTLVNPGDKMWGTIDEKTGVFKATEYANTMGDVYEVEIQAALYINNAKTPVSTAAAIVKVVPSVSGAVIKMGTETFRSKDTLYLSAVVGNSWTLNAEFTPDEGSFSSQTLDPQYQIPCTWTSSDETVLKVVQDKNDKSKCVISAVKTAGGACATGTVTLTLTADDGSGVKTSVYVNVSNQIKTIKLWSNAEHTQEQTELVSGKTMQTYAVVTPSTATNLKLKYEIVNCNSSFSKDENDKGVYATVSTSGKITAKTVYSTHYVILRATSTDGGGASTEYRLKIVPKQTGNLNVQDANGYDITGTTIKMDVLAGSTLQLGSNETNVTYSSSKPSLVSVDPTSGLLTYVGSITKAATVTITVTDNANPLRKATVKVTVTKLVQDGTLSVDGKNGVTDVMAGKKLTMVRTITSPAFNKAVTWSLEANDTPYASISSSGVLTAKKTVTSQTQVTVKATAKDGSGVYATCKVTIYPKVSYITIDDGNEVVSGKTITLDIADGGIQLYETVMNSDAMQTVKWTTSSSKIAKVDSTGLVTFGTKTGKVTIKATSVDGSKKYAKVTIKVVAKVHAFELNLSGKNLESGDLAVRGGTSTTLKAKFTAPAKPGNTKIRWEIPDTKDLAYATITSSGKLTAVKVTGKHLIKVRAIPYDDPEELEAKTFDIWVMPGVTSMAMMSGSVNITGTTQTIAYAYGSIDLDAKILPADASQNVTWKSSSTKYATVDGNGVVTFKKKGTVTITVTAKDGSKKSAKVKLKIV